MLFLERDAIEMLLSPRTCAAIVRQAMVDFSASRTMQPPRQIAEIDREKLMGVMIGDLAGTRYVGAKLVTVFPDPRLSGRQRHQGVAVLFDRSGGAPLLAADAESITELRTAAATWVATEALARPDARRLLLIGCGHQARAHLRVMTAMRDFDQILVWSRTPDRAQRFATTQADKLGVAIGVAADVRDAASESDIICTLTAAEHPVLLGDWVAPGTHINLVGSSLAGPVEGDSDLVVMSRLFVDSIDNAQAQAAEYLRAIDEGRIAPDHIVAEIGEVLAGRAPGRTDPDAITLYKSLGHVVQDLAALRHLYEHHRPDGDPGCLNGGGTASIEQIGVAS